MHKDLVIECIDRERPFPAPPIALEYRHVGYDDFNGTSRVPVARDFVGKRCIFFSYFLVGIFPCFGANTGLFAATPSTRYPFLTVYSQSLVLPP